MISFYTFNIWNIVFKMAKCSCYIEQQTNLIAVPFKSNECIEFLHAERLLLHDQNSFFLNYSLSSCPSIVKQIGYVFFCSSIRDLLLFYKQFLVAFSHFSSCFWRFAPCYSVSGNIYLAGFWHLFFIHICLLNKFYISLLNVFFLI